MINEIIQWQNRPLDPIYPIVYMDSIVVKVKYNQRVINKAIFVALGINMQGIKELLGLWMAENEGAKFWLSVLTELKNRGVEEILIACVDGLKGFPEAIQAVYPEALIQRCNWQDKYPVIAEMWYRNWDNLITMWTGPQKHRTASIT